MRHGSFLRQGYSLQSVELCCSRVQSNRKQYEGKAVMITEECEKAEVVEVCVLCGGEGHVDKDQGCTK